MPIYPVTTMGISNPNLGFKRQMRFLFFVDGVTPFGISAKSPLKSSRPAISFKELQFEHLSETISMPGKIEYKPINLTLYDTYNPASRGSEGRNNGVWNWLKSYHDSSRAEYGFATSTGANKFKRTAFLNMYDGSGCAIEYWVFENAWPQEVNYNEVDMSSNDVMTIDLTLRYDRAYLIQ
jgi:hypothetical protein